MNFEGSLSNILDMCLIPYCNLKKQLVIKIDAIYLENGINIKNVSGCTCLNSQHLGY